MADKRLFSNELSIDSAFSTPFSSLPTRSSSLQSSCKRGAESTDPDDDFERCRIFCDAGVGLAQAAFVWAWMRDCTAASKLFSLLDVVASGISRLRITFRS